MLLILNNFKFLFLKGDIGFLVFRLVWIHTKFHSKDEKHICNCHLIANRTKKGENFYFLSSLKFIWYWNNYKHRVRTMFWIKLLISLFYSEFVKFLCKRVFILPSRKCLKLYLKFKKDWENKRLSSSFRVKFWDYGKHMMHTAILWPLDFFFFHYWQKWNQIL